MRQVWQASLSSSFENVNLMLQYEALVNTFDKINGSSPLHDACYSGSIKCVKALVEAGAQVDLQTKSTKGKNKGAVALHYAAQQNRHDIVEYLIKQSAAINVQDVKGCTPLHYAVYTGRLAPYVVSAAASASVSVVVSAPVSVRSQWYVLGLGLEVRLHAGAACSKRTHAAGWNGWRWRSEHPSICHVFFFWRCVSCCVLLVCLVAGSIDVVRVLLKNKADAAKLTANGHNVEKLMEISPIISKV